MAYIIFTANGEEYDRRELRVPVILGRAPDCDISIPDITLSRHHCRVEPGEDGRGWRIVDLQSKNGTLYLGRPIEQHTLREKDELLIGRTRLTFRDGAFVPATSILRRRGVVRPADPHEALAGTVTGMVLCEPGETEKYEGMPSPQPRPSDPNAFASEDIYGMINEIASSSWDSIQAQASQPIRMQRAMPVPAMTQAQRTVRPKPRVSFALQAEHREQAVPADMIQQAPKNSTKSVASRTTQARRRRWMWAAATALLVAGGVTAYVGAQHFREPAAQAKPNPPAKADAGAITHHPLLAYLGGY